jgi:beta-lactamase regulating signal transducer with metallopeptidase domain
MLQYIINTSIIWLACLVLYELLLRKESFHNYNRAYLLGSIALGLLLPLASLNSFVPANNQVLRQPTEQVYEIKKAVFAPEAPATTATAVSNASPATAAQAPSHWSVNQLLWAVYLLGVAIGIILILREAHQLIRLYSRGSKTRERGCRIVETGNVHCPFSFFNIIFVGRRADYTQSQWTVLLGHEKEHSRQLHSLDNLALIVLRIVFWFHPLPHVYYRKLMMIHEFQADAVAVKSPADYGSFLLEQTLLKGAPVLTHSFNYSPIKNRIAMLTGTRSTQTRLLKYLSIIPLSLLLVLFCTQISFSGSSSAKSHKIVFRGNEIEFGTYKVYPFEYVATMKKQKDVFLYAPLPDTIPMKDWITGNTVMRPVPVETTPIALNGKPIFGEEERYEMVNGKSTYLSPIFNGQVNDPVRFLFARLENDLSKLDDGLYHLDIQRLVVDEKGDLAYYESKGIVADRSSVGRPFAVMTVQQKGTIDRQLFDLLDRSLKFKPALDLDGTPINARLELPAYDIEVKNHKARLFERKGC